MNRSNSGSFQWAARRLRRAVALWWALVLCGLATPLHAAISVGGVNSATTGTATATSLSVNAVAAAVRADLLVAQLTLDDASATVTGPTGWNELSSIARTGTGIQQRIYWRIRSNTEAATYAWSFSKAVHAAVILADITGVDTNLAINASDGRSGTGSTIVAPEVAAAYTNGMLLAFFGTSGSASAITPKTSMTVPTNGKSSAGSSTAGVRLALAYEQIASDGLTGVRTASATSGNYVGQTITLTPAPADICFSDNFNRSALGTDWATSNSKGGFNPTINTTNGQQRLELTQNVTNQATLATLQRYFPAAGNKVVVTFRQYAYPNGGGTGGADGIAAIFSDATVPPVAGADGGSMGYAQKTGVAGFAGGWLGVGIDEYGNYSSGTEGRYLGSTFLPNGVAVRGPSNSFYSASPANQATNGYPYVAGTANGLSPEIDSGTSIASGGGPGYWYRITIDSRVPGEQWVQVERSTDGGSTYSTPVAFFNLMSALTSVFGSGVTLPSIPANFWLSLTGGTGSSTNVHEIDDLQVCATKMVASTASIDHFRFENPGTIDNCQPKTIKVTACTDAAPSCTKFTGGDVYVTLKPTGWVGGDTVKLIGGSGTLQLAQTSVGTFTLDIDKTKTVWPALKNPATYASECVVPGTSTAMTCNLNVVAATAGFGVTFPATSQVACDDPSGDVQLKACSTGYAGAAKNLQFWFSYTDPTTTADSSRVVQISKDNWTSSINLATTAPTSASSPAPVALTFDSAATANIRVKYSDVGKLTLNVRDAAATGVTGSASFIVRPAGFTVSSVTDMSGTANPGAVDATGTAFVAAGMPFKVGVKALNNCSPADVVKNFGKESTAESVAFDKVLVSGLGLTDNPALATLSDFVFANGAGTATLSWPEVGIIQLKPRLKSGSYMGTVDVIGTQTGNIGRFIAHHFDVSLTQGCGTGAFTYDRQPFPSVTVAAKAAGGAPLANYVGSSSASISFAKPVTLTDSTGLGTISAGGAASVPALAFSAGSATLTGADANHPQITYTFNTNPTVASAVTIAATDSDNAGGAGAAAAASMRSGRVTLANAYGSELLDLPLTMRLQYWAGASQGWISNTLDTCTAIQSSDFALGFGGTGNNLVACETSTSVSGFAPNYSVKLTKPGANNTGWTDLTLNLGSTASGNRCVAGVGAAATTANAPWLQFNWTGTVGNPKARATFGRYKTPLIYRRENY